MPPLWVFTDRDRLPDPRAVLAALPKGLCGVVLRPGSADPVLAKGVARLCRQRRFVLAVAGQPRLAARLGACQHASRGWSRRPAGCGVVTASAHDRGELARARMTGALAVFLSPVFATASHPGAGSLGVVRWAALARLAGAPVLALGGINGATAQRLPRFCAGAGAIGAVSRFGVPVERAE